MSKLSTGSKIIDLLLDGGLEPGVTTTLFGPASSGKSNISMLAAINAAEQGKKVLFIDTEGGFSAERVKQLNKNYETLLKNIVIANPTNFTEQKNYFKKLMDAANHEKAGLIIVDSIVMLYRLQKAEEDISTTNQELASQLAILSEVARKKQIPVLVTNQVYADFKKDSSHKGNGFKMVGGDLLKYWSKCIVKLENLEQGVRQASIYKHRSLPEGKSVCFEIKEQGLEEAKVPEREKKGFRLF
jgi:DNA repair protein RadB